MLEIDCIRQEATKKLDQSKRGELGQYLTPSAVANFISSLFLKKNKQNIHILDAGAGIGSLSVALLDCIKKNNYSQKSIELTAYEIDDILLDYLNKNISVYRNQFEDLGIELKANILKTDFITDAVNEIKNESQAMFTHAILNPPYKKINSNSKHRISLREVGIETVNLYSAFVALAIKLVENTGQIVAIIPRSFCNGNYYKPFRKAIIESTAIRQIHLFESRTQAFKDDEVLQENIIIHLEKGAQQGNVIVSRSTNSSLNDYTKSELEFNRVVNSSDPESFIHVPTHEKTHIEQSNSVVYSLVDLGVEVSTGPVVDFRAKDYIFMEPNETTCPLIYPTHFNCKEIDWPKKGKKPNAISINEYTKKMFYPSGYYTVVKRFSSKEEKQRIVARVINPTMLKSEFIGLENHLNVFHFGKKGIDENLAYGIAAYLNSSFVDTYFRAFNGHTQVNATDLKQMKYPNRTELINLGKWAKEITSFDKSTIDKKILKFI